MSRAGATLRIAADIVDGDRQRVHGPNREDFAKIAVLWTAYLAIRRTDGPLTAGDAAHMMALLKTARAQCGEHNPDDYVDGCGYTAIAGEMAGAG